MPSFSEPRVVCRPALPSDTSDVVEFTSRIWEGHDYIRYIWQDWLDDPQGLLVSAQFGPRIVGIAKVTPVFPGQWWLHGLRVDPYVQGRKIGSHLHDYMNAWWLKHGDGTIRLLTSTKRVQVHHLCERTGYRRVGEIITYRRSAKGLVQDPADSAAVSAGQSRSATPAPGATERRQSVHGFEAVNAGDVPSALAFARAHLLHIGGLVDTGWRFVLPDEAVLADFARASHLHWWRDRLGLLATWEGDDDVGPVLGIGFAAVKRPSLLAELLRDAAGLTDRFPVSASFWLAPTDGTVQSALQDAGYTTDLDSGVLFAKQHPHA